MCIILDFEQCIDQFGQRVSAFWVECRRGTKTESARFSSATRDACIRGASWLRRRVCARLEQSKKPSHQTPHQTACEDLAVSPQKEDFSEEARE
ncbi:hypothetical protein TgHK011_006680 [Trichoderma gracile]|nr:hypothetical protein TgHK011_006680 [Trichoderma gracile]